MASYRKRLGVLGARSLIHVDAENIVGVVQLPLKKGNCLRDREHTLRQEHREQIRSRKCKPLPHRYHHSLPVTERRAGGKGRCDYSPYRTGTLNSRLCGVIGMETVSLHGSLCTQRRYRK